MPSSLEKQAIIFVAASTLLSAAFLFHVPNGHRKTVVTDPPSPTWREMGLVDGLPLQNIPVVVKTSQKHKELAVTVANNGTTILEYYSAGQTHIRMLQEVHENGEWKLSNWDWCGTGKSTYEIAPGKQVELYVDFWDPEKRERILGVFSEKDTNRSGLVVLASEPTHN